MQFETEKAFIRDKTQGKKNPIGHISQNFWEFFFKSKEICKMCY